LTHEETAPKKICNIWKKNISEVILSNSYSNTDRPGISNKKGPYRRGTGRGIVDSLAVQKVGKGAAELRPVGYPETYTIPLEEGHNSPINGPVKGKGYFRLGIANSQAEIRDLLKNTAKNITR
jgi:hypothetical protein